MKIIVPCGGKSSRFPNMRPKWMLNAPNGNMMVVEAVKGIKEIKDSNIELIITMLEEHEEKYRIIKGLRKNFLEVLNKEITVCLLSDPTKSQSETVYKTIKKFGIKDSILIKDSDNYFEISNVGESYNYVTIEDLNKYESVNPTNKSYIKFDENKKIELIVEKKIISSHFSIGGYYFNDSLRFCEEFEVLSKKIDDKEIYISDIISSMMFSGEIFFAKHAENYIDWGTIKEWSEYKRSIKTFFIDIDGVLFENGAQYFHPKWGTTSPIIENIKKIKELKSLGNKIVITTSRTEEFREQTKKQFEDVGLEYDYLIMGIGNGQRILINDFSNSNTYPSAVAINIKRNANNLSDYLK